MSTLDENPLCARTYASFRLIGDALVPDDVTNTLQLKPTVAHAAGETLSGMATSRRCKSQRTGVWSLNTRIVAKSTSLERHLISLLDVLEPRAEALEAIRKQQCLQGDFFCFWESKSGHGGPGLSASVLERIAALDADLEIDFYGP
jgi:hypothetical protein